VGKANGSRERAPDDGLRVPTNSRNGGHSAARLSPPYDYFSSSPAKTRKRMIQYSEASVIKAKVRGVLDIPLEPVIVLAGGQTRWRGTTLGADRCVAE
jgi:hypothetical protein